MGGGRSLQLALFQRVQHTVVGTRYAPLGGLLVHCGLG
eukprot:COSAG01_NODE_37422_length_503_cov_46.198020_1_plen_37_part_01